MLPPSSCLCPGCNITVVARELRALSQELQQLTLEDTRQPGGTLWKLVGALSAGVRVRGGMSQSGVSQVCEKLSPWQLYETPDVDHDVANDTDDQDDRASRDNRDPVSRNEYLRPVILSSLAPGTEFLWLTFPPLSSHHPAPRTNPLSLMGWAKVKSENLEKFYASLRCSEMITLT